MSAYAGETITNGTGNCYIDPWYPSGIVSYPMQYHYITSYITSSAPTECSGDVHVFPCPHCDKCKCGGAVKAKAAKR